MVFCPVCGDEAVDVFCEQHLREREPLVEKIEPISLAKCSTCDRIKVAGDWVALDSFQRQVAKSIIYNPRAIIVGIDFPTPVVEKGVKEFTLPIFVEGSVSRKVDPYEEEYQVLVPVEFESCDRCSLASSSYFEGIFQLRNPKDEVITYIENAVQKQQEVFITKVEDVRGGIDFWFTDQKYLQRFVHDVRKQFGGEVKIQSKLHTYDHQRSKKVYRLTALLRLPKFSKGDVIETSKRLVRINRMGAKVYVFDLRRRKKSMIECPTDDEVTLLDQEEVVLSTTSPKPMILDPETYQEVPLAHATDVEPGTAITVVEDSAGKWYATS